jgi:hypothetical protein
VKWVTPTLWSVVLVAGLAAPAAAPLAGCSSCDLRIKTGALPNGVVGVFYDRQLNSECGGDVWFVDEGNLPPGIGLLNDGELRGVPTLAGTFTFTIGVFDFGSGDSASKGFALIVDPST